MSRDSSRCPRNVEMAAIVKLFTDVTALGPVLSIIIGLRLDE